MNPISQNDKQDKGAQESKQGNLTELDSQDLDKVSGGTPGQRPTMPTAPVV